MEFCREFLVGVCRPLIRIQTIFQTKKCMHACITFILYGIIQPESLYIVSDPWAALFGTFSTASCFWASFQLITIDGFSLCSTEWSWAKRSLQFTCLYLLPADLLFKLLLISIKQGSFVAGNSDQFFPCHTSTPFQLRHVSFVAYKFFHNNS